MSTDNGPQPATATQPQTETPALGQVPGEISSLANYMARQKAASSTAEAKQPQAGEGTPQPSAATSPQPDNREQYIPRERFDQVLNERNQLRAQMQPPPQQNTGYAPQMNAGMQVPQLPPQGYQPQFGAVPQYQPQNVGPTGMVGAAPQQQPSAAPDFADPKVQKEWREKIANNPVTGLREFVSLLIQTEGGPLLEQFRQQISSQLNPIQQSFVQQQLSTYSASRQQSDPSFGQVAPMFQQLVSQAVQRGYSLTPQTLQAIEGIARAQLGIPFGGPPAQPQVPFSENPGGVGNLGQAEQPSLSPLEQKVASQFGMSPGEYLTYRRNNTRG